MWASLLEWFFRLLQSCASWTGAPLVFQVIFLEVHLSTVCFKSWNIQCWVQILSFSGRGSGFEFPPSCGSLYWGWGLWWDFVPDSPVSFDGFLFFAWCVVITQPGFILRGQFSICSCRLSVSMGGRESRSFLHCHLEPEPSGIYISLCPKQCPAKILA